MSESDKVRGRHREGGRGMAELTVPSHHGNPFDMQLPYLLPISELYSTIYFGSLYKRHTHHLT